MRAAGRRPTIKASAIAKRTTIKWGAGALAGVEPPRWRPTERPSAMTSNALATYAAKFTRMKLGKRREKSECQIVDRVSPTKFSPLAIWNRHHGYVRP